MINHDTAPIKKRSEVEKTSALVHELFNELPLVYKRYLKDSDILMVLGGLKAATDVTFLGDTYSESEFAVFKSVFERYGLRISELDIRDTRSGHQFRHGYLYNPKTLMDETKNSDLCLPYDGEISINQFIAQCKSAGFPIDYIVGKIYSFPESAIKYFVKPKTKIKSIKTGNETYVIPDGELEEDVQKREEKKKKFFQSLKMNDAFLKIMSDKRMSESDAEWIKRLPTVIRRSS